MSDPLTDPREASSPAGVGDAGTGSTGGADPVEGAFGPRLLLQWFVFPMLAVVVCVGLYLSFRFLTADTKTTQDYLNDLRSGNPHRAWQAAFALANQVNLNRVTDEEKPAIGRDILRMLDESSPSAGPIRQYFILTLGRLNHRDAVPKLLSLAGGPDGDNAEKIYALLALREMRVREALDVATTGLSDPDPGVRKTAAYFFGMLVGSTGALADSAATVTDWADRLAPLLNDPVADVRWNGALSLAELGDRRSVPVLLGLLSREEIESELKKYDRLDETNVEKIIRAALACAARFDDPILRSRVERLAQSDPQPGIQSAAMQTLERMAGAK